MSEDFNALEKAIIEIEPDKAETLAKQIVDSNADPKKLVTTISKALEIVGKKFQNEEYYLPELVMAGEISKSILAIAEPILKSEEQGPKVSIVVGTVQGDLHDLGKNIFVTFASSAGFNVIDLGNDVSVDRFIEAVKGEKARILGLSCLLTATDKELSKVIEALKKENIREKVMVIIGGAAITEELVKEVGGDAFAPDAITGLEQIKEWL
ncbi:MAG: cobalamin B12-binding domain-containing protein [Candidatus Helarchaeota archaeon]|nr:cobalamin B12-binding domain-containing protein [Candidatus Helarchaeota archaeon]